MIKLADLIRKKRREANLTQEELAEKVGISLGYIGKIEIGLQNPGPKTLIKLMKVLDIKDSEVETDMTEFLAIMNERSDRMGDFDNRFNALHPRVKAFLLDLAPIVVKYL